MDNDDIHEPAATIDIQTSQKTLPADECSTLRLTITAKDRFGELVMNQTGVWWWLKSGLGEFVEKEEETRDGKASAILRSGFKGEEMIISAQVDSVTVSVAVTIKSLKITLKPESAILSVDGLTARSFPSRTRVTAAVMDEDGAPVADGTKIDWFIFAGIFEEDGALPGNWIETETLNGCCTVCINAQGARAGNILLCAAVTSFFDSCQLQFVPRPGLHVASDRWVLAGDKLTDGTLEVERLDHEPFQAPFHATAKFIIQGGIPNTPATVHLTEEGADFLELVGNDATELDANGEGCFLIRSNGSYRKGDIRFYPVCVKVSQGQDQTVATIKVGPARIYAFVYDLGHLLLSDRPDPDTAAAEFAAGMIIGAKSPRDLAFQLTTMPKRSGVAFAQTGFFGDILEGK